MKSRILVVTVEKDSHSPVDLHLIDGVVVPRLRASDFHFTELQNVKLSNKMIGIDIPWNRRIKLVFNRCKIRAEFKIELQLDDQYYRAVQSLF